MKRATAQNLPELLDAMQCDAFDDREMSALPTFGGPEPRDTTEIWSWDATHVITGTHPGDYTIEKRDTKCKTQKN
tara:strand:- start:374 stop:598 length:225 start_codon:yes stop_codon:yes gene_type:complete